MAGESNLTSQFQRAFQGMTITQKAMVAAIMAAVLLTPAGLGVRASQGSVGTLFTNRPPPTPTASSMTSRSRASATT